ncbi:MAG: hydroxypyruvate isomerase family protein [Planctomycetota bacterium]
MTHTRTTSTVTRRTLLHRAAGLAAGAAAAGPSAFCNAATQAGQTPIKHGRVKQSMAFWCFNVGGKKWTIQQQVQVARRLGCQSIELLDPEHFPVLLENNLVCAITNNGMPGQPFVKGLNNLDHHEEIIARTRKRIDANAEAGFPNVIAFNGFKWRDPTDPQSGEIPPEEGAKNCVEGLKKLASQAERKNVTVCVEMLNTRDDSHPMKGHPGYQGDDMDYVADIIKKVGSPHVKILFDIYHLQIMNGDIIRRIQQYSELIGHVHTAGNPGRCELDEDQEINYPACMRALVKAGYDGYVGHEFIPTRDPMDGLIQAVTQCDV